MDACKRNTALTVEKFNDLFDSLPSVHLNIQKRRTAVAALYMYLMKMRTGLPTEDIGNQFHVSATSVQRLISKIRTVLKNDLVPQHVNYVRDREELIEHNTPMSNGLLDPENEHKVMLICDGTYIFVDKSRNYIHQKKSFSGQKKRNFLKVMMITACDGKIIYSIAPYPATLNDASILKSLFEKTVILDNLINGDILLLDRGFRDVVPTIERTGLVVKMPSLVQNSDRKGQLSTLEANKSRLVTALRYAVETRNGHLKTIWKMFNHNWSSFAQMNLGQDVEICVSLINKYFRTFESNRDIAPQVANRMLAKLREVNIVGNVVSKDRFQRLIKDFTRFNNYAELPTLTKEHLFFISLGGYPIKQAESYTQMHIKQNNDQFIAWVCPDNICRNAFQIFFTETRDPLLFMLRLNSRFRSNKTHSVYVLIDRNGAEEKAVLGHYCECYNGWRTVGCCSHVMTLIAFLLHTKGQNLTMPAGFLDNLFNDE